jgi:phosphoglycerol transferase MdoB-like AlkP superfamily enzyme
MKSRLLFLLKYYFFWIIIFIVQKIAFLFFNYKESFDLSIGDWFLVIFNGLKLDFSAAAYLLLIPSILTVLSFEPFYKTVRKIINIYTYFLLFFVLYLGVVDMDLYSYWGFKLDITPLLYIKTPGEALASVSILEISLLILFFALLFYVFFRFYRMFFQPKVFSEKSKWWTIVLSGLLFTTILIIPARGGFGIATMNLSRVYFSQNRFANHSAINVFWNTMYSYIERNKLREDHNFMDDEKAQEIFHQMMDTDSIFNTPLIKKNPNLLIVILESFSDKIIESLGGEAGITPNINQLCKESIVFTNFYASGDRSDKGLVSIFSGFPAQPTTSIIDYPAKSQDLPFLYKTFSEKDYSTAFYYGGDINFANFKAYFSSPYIQNVKTIDDFPASQRIQKWGVPDEFLFNKMLTDMNGEKGKFFYSCFTLSSHEPFDVPMEPVFGTDNRDQLSKSSFYYTDSCIGDFLKKAREQDWYDNTLIVFIADHGSRSPGNTPNHVEEKFRIPMIWTGGAILKERIIQKCGSQVDLPTTILAQYGEDFKAYPYSKDLANPLSGSFAFYAFNNGFGFKTDSSLIVYDNDFRKIVDSEGVNAQSSLVSAQAFLQVLSADFLSK